MRLLFIVDETFFFHPEFVNDFIERKKYTVSAVALVTSIPKKSSLSRYLVSKFYYLKINEIVKLVIIYIKLFLKNSFTRKSKNIFSVESVLIKNNIPYFKVKNKINKKKYIEKIKNIKPDIIISSNSLYLGKEILSIPNIMCINRHSSNLPSYKGLWPIFHAFINKEKFIGVSIHKMNNFIDGGDVISSATIEIKSTDTIFSLYQKAFKISVEELINALDIIENNKSYKYSRNIKESYYSWPDKKDWKKFRKLNGKFI